VPEKSEKRYVFLDPDGTLGDEWIYVIVEAPTGIMYGQQYGGTAGLESWAEGYLVPVSSADSLAELMDIFERALRGRGAAWPFEWPSDLLERLRQVVNRTWYWPAGSTAELSAETRARLVLDESRMRILDEAWVPVRTPDGPAVLVWLNSD
jgi:uncharacterized protein DUF6210